MAVATMPSSSYDFSSRRSVPSRQAARAMLILRLAGPPLLPVLVGSLIPVSAAQPTDATARDAFLREYCHVCHRGSDPAGGLPLEGLSAEDPSSDPDTWERVARKLAYGEMPPAGAHRPDQATIDAFHTGLIEDLDAEARENPHVGAIIVRRLNRREYGNAIRDLLAIEVPVAQALPSDGQAAGFDNIADALSMSPLLLEQYLKVARRVSELALGVSEPSPVTETYQASGTQAFWQGHGMPYGTRGGVRINHHFPYDGEYELRAFLEKQTLTPTEGVRFFRTKIRLRAGPHEVVVAFPDEFAAREGPVLNVSGPGGRALGGPLDLLGTAIRPTVDFRIDGRRVKLFEIAGMTSGESAFDGLPGPPVLGRIEIAGPYDPTGVSETPSRRRILVCKPSEGASERDCASKILSAIVRRAFRRDTGEADVRPFVSTYEAARASKPFDASIAAAIRDILLAPDFLFRLESDHGGDGAAQLVSGFELASRLSFFLWSSIPDDELLDAASRGVLYDPVALAKQVGRLLMDPRASSLVESFASQWLGLRELAGFRPDRAAYPEFDTALTAAFQQETQLFLQSIVRENRSILDLLGANHTFLNEKLARHYRVEGVVGPGFRRVTLADSSKRGGLLGQGSVLMVTSHAAKTSPVLRGKWILDNLLNSPPPPPPPNVPPLVESAADGKVLATRAQVERHRADPGCASCHDRIDPLGFALENFDVLGRWRTLDGDEPIDASGALPTGEAFVGPDGLKRLLLKRPERFAGATVERLLTYALGRALDARDQPAVRQILRDTESDGYRFQDMVLAVVRSAPFQMRQAASIARN